MARCVFPSAVDHARRADFVMEKPDLAGAPDVLNGAAKAKHRTLARFEVHPRVREQGTIGLVHVFAFL